MDHIDFTVLIATKWEFHAPRQPFPYHLGVRVGLIFILFNSLLMSQR